jgi:hypothetical protein
MAPAPELGFGRSDRRRAVDSSTVTEHASAVFSWVPAFASWITQYTGAPQPPGSNPGPQAGPSLPQPVIRPPVDTAAPVLSRVRLAKSRLRPGKRTTLTFRLSEAAAVTVTLLRKQGSRLKAISRVPFAASAGTVKRGFAARVRSKPLKPGRYVLRVAAVDTAGNRSRVVSVAFRVLP